MTCTPTDILPAITKSAYGCEPILHIAAQLLYLLSPAFSRLKRSALRWSGRSKLMIRYRHFLLVYMLLEASKIEHAKGLGLMACWVYYAIIVSK